MPWWQCFTLGPQQESYPLLLLVRHSVHRPQPIYSVVAGGHFLWGSSKQYHPPPLLVHPSAGGTGALRLSMQRFSQALGGGQSENGSHTGLFGPSNSDYKGHLIISINISHKGLLAETKGVSISTINNTNSCFPPPQPGRQQTIAGDYSIRLSGSYIEDLEIHR